MGESFGRWLNRIVMASARALLLFLIVLLAPIRAYAQERPTLEHHVNVATLSLPYHLNLRMPVLGDDRESSRQYWDAKAREADAKRQEKAGEEFARQPVHNATLATAGIVAVAAGLALILTGLVVAVSTGQHSDDDESTTTTNPVGVGMVVGGSVLSLGGIVMAAMAR